MVTAASSATKTQILDVAERAIAEYGYAGTTLRYIVGKANVNLAAVHYHFGSKEELFEALVARIAEPIVSGQLAQLKLLTAEGSEPPSTAAILRAYLEPCLACFMRNDADWQIRAQFSGRCRTEPAPIQAIADKQFNPTAEKFLDVLQRALPDQPRSQLTWKMDLIVTGLLRTFAEAGNPGALLKGNSDEDIETALSKLVSFFLPGLESP